jgi:hypothetical protein
MAKTIESIKLNSFTQPKLAASLFENLPDSQKQTIEKRDHR